MDIAVAPAPVASPGSARVRDWALRLLPPLLLLWPLGVRNGAVLYLCGIALMPFALWSFVTFTANLIRWQPRRMVRPGLCLAIVLAWPYYLACTMAPAVRYADALAERIQARCDVARRCPAHIGGWSPGHGTLYGDWVRWRIRYFTDGTDFSVHVVLGFDWSQAASGGVGKRLRRIDTR